MTIDELKQELSGKSFPQEVMISPDQIVFDPELFLRTQFIMVDAWKKDIEKCPAYIRLVRFKDAISNLEQ
ncbi:DUF6965 family protein [Sphingobacterium deserti]|uniref:DUF6965 domain-containing protein n=1 Tax=Sphingobacterium deserti TaxID=1229276 RepID=A0A0B8SZZ9_9SPHI|nr:hypothetical protein [Sphingobacterium deserti]KGE13371.1 hypothetical protein DI53_2902 [Sphingobacterium deserti]